MWDDWPSENHNSFAFYYEVVVHNVQLGALEFYQIQESGTDFLQIVKITVFEK
jgi:hypothetical protein